MVVLKTLGFKEAENLFFNFWKNLVTLIFSLHYEYKRFVVINDGKEYLEALLICNSNYQEMSRLTMKH